MTNMKWARNGILSDDGCAMLIERSTKKGNARTSRALGRRPVGGVSKRPSINVYIGIPTAATCVCTHGRPQRSTDVLAGPTQFGSIRVVGDFLCRPRLASEGGFHGCDGKNVLLKFRSAGVRLRRGCST